MNKIIYKLDGYYTYQDSNPFNLCTFIWYIPKELHNNEIVKARMNHQPFENLIRHINGINVYNYELKHKYLDVEKESLLKKKKELKWKCHQILNEINYDLSPYHWELQKDTNSDRRDCYLIGLFTGENRIEKEIESL